MPFPLTHLCVAWKLKRDAQFLLGSISPDAVHYRAEFLQRGVMNKIGPTKKISHLCPVSDERWGQVTDNDGWVRCVEKFLRENPGDIFAAGYAAHCLTDICNNKTIWHNFRTNHPDEAAKGYASDYYTDLRNIDAQLYLEFPGVPEIMETLATAVPEGLPGLVSAEETAAIKNNILNAHFKDVVFDKNYEYKFVKYEDTLNFIQEAAEFVVAKLLADIVNNPKPDNR